MDRSPKILVITDEPMLMVDMMSELEGRGFAVEPMKPGDHRNWLQTDSIDAAIFDLDQPDDLSTRIVSKLHHAAIPLITLGDGAPFKSERIAGAEICLAGPVDYDKLSDLLFELVSGPHSMVPHSMAAAVEQSSSISPDDR